MENFQKKNRKFPKNRKFTKKNRKFPGNIENL